MRFTERPREQGWSTNSEKAMPVHQHHWYRLILATSMAMPASHILELAATCNAVCKSDSWAWKLMLSWDCDAAINQDHI